MEEEWGTRQVQLQVKKVTYKDPVLTLEERSDIANVLKAPYTVFAKKIDGGLYSWIIYSLGRPQNIVWGTLTINEKGHKLNYTIEYGCKYPKRNIINKMLEIKRKAGYVIIATLARDQASPRIISHTIVSAYNERLDLNLPLINIFMSYRDMDLALLDICDEYGLNLDSGQCQIFKAAEILAESLIDKPNMESFHGSTIPKSVAQIILDYIEHTPALNENMSVACYELSDCMDRRKGLSDKVCGLYHPLPEEPEDQLM